MLPMSKHQNKTVSAVTRSSGNVFADMNVPDAGEALNKARIAHEVCELIHRQSLNQTEAAELLGVDQPMVSALMRGRLQGCSTDRLLRFLTALGQDVDIVIHPGKSGPRAAKIRITEPA